jgi:hypothetical protein
MTIIIIIIITIIIPFMQGIHTYIPETNHVSRVHSTAAIPRVLLMVHIALPSLCVIIIIIIIIRISHYSALAGKYSPILGCINRIRLGGVTCNLGNFLQLSMCQELPLFASVYMCLGAG